MEYHPIANVFPLMAGEDYRHFVEDIRKHGLLEPIILYEGKILDGRNRYRACTEAGVPLRSQEWRGEGGSPVDFVWSKNAERRQLTQSQRAMAVQAHMEYLSREAKERQRISPGRPSEKGSPNSDYLSERTASGNPGKAAEHAARLAGVGKTIIYEAKKLSERAETDPKAAELAQQVKAGEMSVDRANKILTSDDDEHAAALRRRRSPVALVATPPSEDASSAAKTRYASRPVRVLADYLGGLRLEMERHELTITKDALDAWWDAVETREWEQVQANLDWFERVCEPMLKFVHWKASRKSVPPMVERLSRRQARQA